METSARLFLLVSLTWLFDSVENVPSDCEENFIEIQEAYKQVYSNLDCSDPGDQELIKLVENAGCRVERHQVTTTDGYILTLHRPVCRNFCSNPRKGPVLLIPGIDQSSICWVWNPPDESLGFLLAKACYDVWLLNPRGTAYSLNHVNTSCHEPEYWDFSIDEAGKYDVPETMDYILGKTQKYEMPVVAHSMGAAQVLATLSTQRDCISKVSLLVLANPAAIMTNSPYALLALAKQVRRLLQCVSGPELENNNVIQTNGSMCNVIPGFAGLCNRPLITGSDDAESPEYFNNSMIPFYSRFTPLVASLGCFSHFVQLKLTEWFQFYDHGVDNFKIYGQDSPPLYELERVKTPVVLISAERDNIVSGIDVSRLKSQLPTVVCAKELVNATHRDFLWSKDKDAVQYPLIICMMDESIKCYPRFGNCYC